MTGSADARHIAVVVMADLDAQTARALKYASTLTPHVLAVHVREAERQPVCRFEESWARLESRVPLVVLDPSPGDGEDPLLQTLDVLRRTQQADLITVVMPPRSAGARVRSLIGALATRGIVVRDTPADEAPNT